MNSAIELHDTFVSGIERQSNNVIIHFSEAYIHKSQGEIGVAPSTGWIQAAELTLTKARMVGKLPTFPAEVDDGYIKVNEKPPSMIPIPLDYQGDIELKLMFYSGEEVTLNAEGAKLRLLGDAEFIENFPH